MGILGLGTECLRNFNFFWNLEIGSFHLQVVSSTLSGTLGVGHQSILSSKFPDGRLPANNINIQNGGNLFIDHQLVEDQFQAGTFFSSSVWKFAQIISYTIFDSFRCHPAQGVSL